jgi:hypothetical protein
MIMESTRVALLDFETHPSGINFRRSEDRAHDGRCIEFWSPEIIGYYF